MFVIYVYVYYIYVYVMRDLCAYIYIYKYIERDICKDYIHISMARVISRELYHICKDYIHINMARVGTNTSQPFWKLERLFPHTHFQHLSFMI